VKQIVDFEQAKRLYEAGVYLVNSDYVIKKNGRLYQTDVKQPYYNSPTIGELIEWIKGNRLHQSLQLCIRQDHLQFWVSLEDRYYPSQSITVDIAPELIDALVELAIKIKESSNE